MTGFQWDEEKSAANEAKHCVSFLQAAHIFRGFILRREDTRRDYGEKRFIALGAFEGNILKIVYTNRDGDIRIIQLGRQGEMTVKPTNANNKSVRYENVDAFPPAPPLSAAFRQLSDEEAELRALDDPDAGIIPNSFWDNAEVIEPEGTEQITLRLPKRVLRHFKATGKGYQSRINAVLLSYVDAKQQKAR